MSKKERRLESKKRKAEAFLAVAKLNDSEKSKKKKPNSEDEQETTSEAVKLEMVAKDTSQMTAEECVEEALQRMRQEKRLRQKTAMGKAKVFTTPENLRMVSEDGSIRDDLLMPLFVVDLQHLLLYATQGNIASYKPRWCKLLRPGKVEKNVVISLEGVSIDDYKTYGECFPFIKEQFESPMEMVTPTQYGKTVKDELFTVPWSESFMKQTVKDTVFKMPKDRREMTKVIPVAKDQTEANAVDPSNDVFSRQLLLHSPAQMIQEVFPLPVVTDSGYCDEYIATKEEYTPVTARSPMFGLDCEMCMTECKKNELTWIAVVNEKMETVYQTLVKPHNTITNFLTKYSGVTPGMLNKITTRLGDVQQALRRILPSDAILCGHSLQNDLHALKMFHPYVIDTSVIYNLRGVRQYKPALRLLTSVFLKREIQDDPLKGHNPVEDATASLQLVQLKLRNSRTFGDVLMGGSLVPTPESVNAVCKEIGKCPASSTPAGDNSETNRECKGVESEVCQNGVSEKSRSKHDCANQMCDEKCDTAERSQGELKCVRTQSDNNQIDSPISKMESTEPNCKEAHETSSLGQNCDKLELNSDNKNVENSNICSNESSGAIESGKIDNDNVNESENTNSCEFNAERRRRELLSGMYRLQRNYFFDNLGYEYSQDFFQLVHKANKSAIVIGKEEDVRKLGKMEVQVCSCETDKQKVRKLKENRHISFSFTELSFYSDCQVHLQSEEKIKKCLRKLDDRVKRILQYLEENTLVTVLMTGRSDQESCHNAMCLVKIL